MKDKQAKGKIKSAHAAPSFLYSVKTIVFILVSNKRYELNLALHLRLGGSAEVRVGPVSGEHGLDLLGGGAHDAVGQRELEAGFLREKNI